VGLVGCLFMPHPPIVVPAVGGERVHEVQATLEAMRAAGREAADLCTEVIVLLSPHAPLDADRVTVCTAPRYVGSLAMFGAPQVRADLRGEVALARAIIHEAAERHVPLLEYGEGSERVALDHGALVPLAFLLEQLGPPPALVELNFSFRSPQVHLSFGAAVGAAIDSYPARVLYVASGDLSHRLTPDAPAGYAPRGADFDRQVVEALREGDLESLSLIPPGLTEEAGECGYRSLLVLAGLLRGRSSGTRLLSYEGPFGVGYMVCVIDLRNKDGD